MMMICSYADGWQGAETVVWQLSAQNPENIPENFPENNPEN